MIQQLPSSGHHRTSSAPPAPIPPPPPGIFNLTPPQPPPMPSSNGDPDHSESVVDQTSSLAVQLQAARLKRTNKVFFLLLFYICDLILIFPTCICFKATSN